MKLCRTCFDRLREQPHNTTRFLADLDRPATGDCDNRSVSCDNLADYIVLTWIDGGWQF